MRRFLSSLAFALFFVGLVQPAAAQTYVPGTEATWYGSVGTIMLTRENPESRLIATDFFRADTGYNTSVVDFDPQFGYDTTIGRRLGDGFGVEARYFEVNMGTNLPTFFDANGLFTAFNNNTNTLGFSGLNVVAQGKYKSELQSFELNLRQQVTSNIGMLYGFRYFELAEELKLNYTSPGIPGETDQSIRGRNEMFGGQLGFDALLLERDWWSVTTFAKSGLYYNDAHSRVNQNFINTTANSSAGNDDELAFAVEAGLKFNVLLTRRLSLQTGYNVMWLDGVALASNQIAGSDPAGFGVAPGVNPTVPAPVDTTQLFLHGMTLGLTYAW